MSATADPRDPLAPLRAGLLARAEADAASVRADSEAERRRIVAAARHDADAVLAEARAAGQAEAAQLLALDVARARRSARAVVLAAQREVYDELRGRAADALRAALEDPARRDALAARAAGRLGAQVTVAPAPGGGFVAQTSDGRRVDASVDALVEQALAGMDLGSLWTAP